MFDNKLHGMQHIFYMYPGESLFAGSNLSSDKKAEWQQHFRQCPSILWQYNPKTDYYQPDVSRQFLRLIFPTDTDIRQETRSHRRAAFRINTVIRINADGWCGDKYFRLHFHFIDDRYQPPGSINTAVHYFTFGFPCPTLVYRSSGQIDYNITSGQCLFQLFVRPRTEHRMFQRDNDISTGR